MKNIFPYSEAKIFSYCIPVHLEREFIVKVAVPLHRVNISKQMRKNVSLSLSSARNAEKTFKKWNIKKIRSNRHSTLF